MSSAFVIAFLGLGIGEILVVAIVALLVFGGELPDVMRSMGRAYAKFRESLSEIAKPVREEFRDVPALPSARETLRDISRDVTAAGTKQPAPAPTENDTGAADASKAPTTPAPLPVDDYDDEPPPV
ncbi:MAG: twin-arginine translocase TatA/TatE family subunit [bacterium]|nr:twin-arginine translocase TatA/TatE family subunit [bacterium]